MSFIFINMNKEEKWKAIAGYEGYEISSLGKVKSLNYKRTGKEKILKPKNNGKGYLRVALYKDGKCKYFLIHRLVGEAFIPNPMGLPEINHKDENKSNNIASNIEWCDRRYNNNYGTHTERSAAAQRNNPDRSKAVVASRFSDFRTIELRFASISEAGRNGYHQGSVSDCCKGCYSTHRGNFYKNLYWRYAS